MLFEVIWNKVEYTFKDSPKSAVQFEDCSDSKVIQSILNERTFKYHFGVGRLHILPHSYTFASGFCFNSLLQVWVIGNQIYQITPFRYINHNDEVYLLVRVSKVLCDMEYFMRLVKLSAEAVGIWTENHLDVKRVNSLYTMLSGRFNFKINKHLDSLSLSLGVRYLYTRRGYIIGELNEVQYQAWQAQNKKR